MVYSSTAEMIKEYEKCEAHHKTIETHHPDGIGWSGGILSTIECVFDVYSSLLRTAGVHRAYDKLLEILRLEKFSNLSPSGVYGALLHLHIRGVATSEKLREKTRWRTSHTQEFLYSAHLTFRSGDVRGAIKSGLITKYHVETALHCMVMNQELKRLRFRTGHDYSKFIS